MKGLIYTGKKEEAAQLFFDGYNCSQSVVAAFSEDFGIPKDVALKFSEGLGGGVGRMRDMCGAVTGMAIVLSMRYGSADLNDKDNKAKVYALVQQAARSCVWAFAPEAADASFPPLSKSRWTALSQATSSTAFSSTPLTPA